MMRDFVLDTYSKYRDFSKLKKQNKVDVQDFVSNYISVGDKKKVQKSCTKIPIGKYTKSLLILRHSYMERILNGV